MRQLDAARDLRGPPVDRPDEEGDDEVPQEADRDHRRADGRRIADDLAGRPAAEPVDDRRQLQADQDEQRRVEQEGEDRPQRVALHPALRRGDLGSAEAEVDAAGDHRQHARDAELVGRDERPVGAEQRDRQLGVDVVDALAHLGDHPADGEPDRDPAGHVAEELEHGVPRRDALADRGRHRDLVGDQRGGVVEQALALEHVDHPPRRADPPHDRRRRRRVGRRDDRAEDEGHRPGQADQLVRDDRDRRRRRQHEPDRRQRDDPRVRAQGAQVGEEGRGVEQRRQEDEQDEFRVELDVRDAGTSPSTSPPITSGIGYGTLSQLASAFSPAAETNSAAMTICRSPTARNSCRWPKGGVVRRQASRMMRRITGRGAWPAAARTAASSSSRSSSAASTSTTSGSTPVPRRR